MDDFTPDEQARLDDAESKWGVEGRLGELDRIRGERESHFYSALEADGPLDASTNGARCLAKMKARGVEFEDRTGFFMVAADENGSEDVPI